MKRSTQRELQRRFPVMVLSENLRTLLREASGDAKEVFGQMVLHFDTGLQRALHKHSDRLGIAAGAHDAIDAAMRVVQTTHDQASEIKCRKGCDACCHMNVDVSSCEAQLLAACVKDLHLEVDRDRLRKQAAGFHNLPPAERACVFLKEGACSVYEHRPGACRKLVVVTDPDLCDTIKHPGGKVGGLASGEAEVLWSVLMTRDKGGSMPAMLLEQLAKQGAAHG